MSSNPITIRDFATLPGTLQDDDTTWEFPNVSSVNSRGKELRWQIIVRVYKNVNGSYPTNNDQFLKITEDMKEAGLRFQFPLPK